MRDGEITDHESPEALPNDMPVGVAEGDPSAAHLRVAPGPAAAERLACVKAATNPLLEAAQPLLRALADMDTDLDPTAVGVLRDLLEREIAVFQSLCNDAQIRHEHAVAASYALCTALDEAASSTQWGGAEAGSAGVWAARPLAAQFHGDIRGGDKFFLLIGRLAASPQDHIDLLELMYLVLGLGFEGRFSTASNGRRQLETIRHRLQGQITAVRGEVPQALSAQWRGGAPGRLGLLRSVPVWLTAAAACAAALGLFAWYRYQLDQSTLAVEKKIRAIASGAAVGEAAPPAPQASLRLRDLLAGEIAKGLVSVREDQQRSAVSFSGDAMFMPGRATLDAAILPVLNKVADEIARVPGRVQVTGHTDSVPIRSQEFASNQALSERRAEAVAAVLRQRGVRGDRITVQGRGDTLPLADNLTPAGRAKNRRVDIVVDEASAEGAAAAAMPAQANGGGGRVPGADKAAAPRASSTAAGMP